MPDITTSWPFGVGILFMLAAAVCQWRIARVPNALTIGFFIVGIVVAAAATGQVIPAGGNIQSSLLGAFVGFVSLLPFHVKIGLGAGCVKAQCVFGVWVGAAFTAGITFPIVVIATISSCVLTLILGFVYAKRMAAGSLAEIHEFPAQIPLSVGTMLAAVIFLSF